MNRITLIILLYAIVCACPVAKAADADSLATVRGRSIIYQDANKKKASAAPFVFISLISQADTVSTMSDSEGSFLFEGIKTGKKRLVASSVNYKTSVTDIDVLPGDNAVMIEVKVDYSLIEAAVATAAVSPIEMRGDTLVFQPAAVRTLEGDSALEILRQMPGVEIKNGAIYVNGQKVERAYVNGVMLFGDNPMAPLNTLMASEVTQIHSYEEASVAMRLKGETVGKKDRVLNIRTKDNFVSAWDAFAQAAGGVDSAPREDGKPQLRYFAGANANFFSESFLLNINTYSNNVGLATNLYRAPELIPGSLGEYHRQHYATAGVQRYWGDRLLGNNIKIDYSYQDDYSKQFSRGVKTYRASFACPERMVSDTLSDRNSNGTHLIKTVLTINDNKLKSLLIVGRASISNQESGQKSSEWSRIKDGNSFSVLESRHGTSKSWSADYHFKWSNPSAEKIIPTLFIDLKKAPSDGENWTVDTLASSLNRRYLNILRGNDNYSIEVNPSATFRLKNTDKETASLSAGYYVSYESQQNTQVGLDYFDASGALNPPDTNAVNTFNFSRKYYSHGPELGFHKSTKKLYLSAWINPRFATASDTEQVPTHTQERNLFFLPKAVMDLKWNKLVFTYDLDSGIPASEQIRNRLNDNNPLYLVAGNPSLKPAVTHSAQASYNLSLPNTSANLQFAVRFGATHNAIVSKVSYFAAPTYLDDYNFTTIAGSSLSTFVNSPGLWNTNLSVTYSNYSKKINSPIQCSLLGEYRQSPVYRGDNLLLIRDFTPSLHLRLTPTLRRVFRFTIIGSVDYQQSGTDSGLILTRAIRSGGSISVTWNAPKYYFAKGNYSINLFAPLNNGFSNVVTQHFALSAGVRLLNNKLRISVSANDILNAGSSYSVKTTDDYVLQSWTPSYGRYYLLSICYRINTRQSSTRFRGQLGDGQVQRY